MEWTVVLALTTLVGLFLTVGKPILNLNSAVTKLQLSVDKLEAYQKMQDDEIKAHNARIDDHERRITKLETLQEKSGS